MRNSPDSSNPFPNLNNLNHVSDENGESQIDSNFVNAKESDFSGHGDDNVEKSNRLGDSVLLSELENWADQYKKDSEYWGVGSGPIFTIYEDSIGNVHRVSVNKDEILRRSGVESRSFKSHKVGEYTLDLNSKISRANLIARELESGEYKFPKNSSIAASVVQSKQTSLVDGFRSAAFQGNSLSTLSRIGFAMLCGCFIYWATKKLFVGEKNEPELMREEEEMLRRKMRSRMEKKKMESGNVEVLGNDLDLKPPVGPITRPQLDKDALMKSIFKAKAANENLAILDSSDKVSASERDFSGKIMEIQEMARQAREIERRERSKLVTDGEGTDVPVVLQAVKEETGALESGANKKIDAVVKALESDSINEVKSLSPIESGESLGRNNVAEITSLDNTVKEDIQFFSELSASSENSISQNNTRTSNMEVLKNDVKTVEVPSEKELNRMRSSHVNGAIQSRDLSNSKSSSTSQSSVKMKPMLIRSVEEAKDYLSQKSVPLGGPHVQSLANDTAANGKEHLAINEKDEVFKPSKFVMGASEDSALSTELSDESGSPLAPSMTGSSDSLEPCSAMNAPSMHTDGIDRKPLNADKSWMEENFQEFDPVIKKIGVGFQENYMMAKQKVQEESSLSADLSELGFKEDDVELEWMKDDGLRKIVFKVRDNELAGRDPFHLMDAEDKNAFFTGLERKVEKVNEKLLGLHEWVHSRIENLDYGSGMFFSNPCSMICKLGTYRRRFDFIIMVMIIA